MCIKWGGGITLIFSIDNKCKTVQEYNRLGYDFYSMIVSNNRHDRTAIDTNENKQTFIFIGGGGRFLYSLMYMYMMYGTPRQKKPLANLRKWA